MGKIVWPQGFTSLICLFPFQTSLILCVPLRWEQKKSEKGMSATPNFFRNVPEGKMFSCYGSNLLKDKSAFHKVHNHKEDRPFPFANSLWDGRFVYVCVCFSIYRRTQLNKYGLVSSNAVFNYCHCKNIQGEIF